MNGQKPAGVPLSEWIQAVGIALGRGLPLTGESVAGLHQAVFGPPLHVLLSSLEEQMAGFLRQAGQEATTASSGQTTSTFPLAGTASQASGANPPTAEGAAVQAGATPLGGGAQSNQAAGLVQLARQGAFADAVSGPQTVQPGLQGQAAGGTGGALVAKLQAVLAELQASMLQEGMDGGSVPGRGSSGPVGGSRRCKRDGRRWRCRRRPGLGGDSRRKAKGPQGLRQRARTPPPRRSRGWGAC